MASPSGCPESAARRRRDAEEAAKRDGAFQAVRARLCELEAERSLKMAEAGHASLASMAEALRRPKRQSRHGSCVGTAPLEADSRARPMSAGGK